MSPIVGIISFRDKSIELSKATTWLDHKGFNCDKTRIGQYKRDLEALANKAEQGTLQELIENRKYENLVISLFESSEILNMYHGLKLIKDEHLITRLKRYLKGAFASNQEKKNTASSHARDIGFELTIAAYFAKANFTIDFGTDADLMVSDYSKLFFIECKRPRSFHSLSENVHKAFKQLKSRYAIWERARGIVALSISKLINPELNILNATNENELDDILKSESSKFILNYSKLWQREIDIRTIGVLIYLSVPAVIQSHNIVTTCVQFAAQHNSLKGTNDYHYFKRIADRLAATVKQLP